MKKKFSLLLIVLVALLVLSACGKSKAIEVWVGIESQAFYQQKADEYIENYNANNEKAFPVAIEVKAVDTGTAAGVFLNDPTKAGDIITTAHDNLGKLIAGSSAIAPLSSETLIAQVENDNYAEYVNVTKGFVAGKEYHFGVPYVAQSLILYYDKSKVSSEQVKTWEGLLEAAEQANTKALSVTGTDGFNNSFVLLSIDEETKTSSLQLYQGGDITKNYATGADVLSAIKWGQYLFTHQHGVNMIDADWHLKFGQSGDNGILSIIGGAWHFDAAYAALGENLGIAKLPTFTLTENTVYDVANNPDLVGRVMRSGTFADVKMFVKNKVSKHADLLDDLLEFFSSKEVQEQSFLAAQNLPSYKDAVTEFEAFQGEQSIELLLASVQIEMFEYGIPQPFGFHPNFNFYYYSKNGPERFLDILENKDNNFNTDAKILAEMKILENIWKTGKADG